MAPSTSPASPPPAEAFGLDALSRFYRFHARVYDWTRPLLLFGRRAAVARLAARPGDTVLDVGCGTGFSLPLLASSGARVVGIEPSLPMRQRAEARVASLALGDRVALDPRPYGTHRGYEGSVDRILFSYSLSMVPPYELVLEQAARDLRKDGRIVAVDFLDARPPVSWGLRASHVFLGEARLQALRRLFPDHAVDVRGAVFWRFFRFEGRAPLILRRASP
jgi:S-adenosylmethionine-diacylgycerolhomoserine-N-methlytransferase